MVAPQPDPYAVLGVAPSASAAEIKAAYRALVKRHHPDAGGDDQRILALNAAWEVLGDGERRRQHDRQAGHSARPATPAGSPGGAPAGAGRLEEQQRLEWLLQRAAPIDRLLGQVINPFATELRALAADPYDDALMEHFCAFLEASQARLAKAEALYRSQPCPAGLEAYSLGLYHCLSLVKDALVDLQRYTLGYVDSYLRDGREQLRQARARRSALQAEARQLRS